MTPATAARVVRSCRIHPSACGRHAQYRPCALDPAPLEEVPTWADQYRHFWEARFDRMDDYLTQLRSLRRTDENDD